MEILPIEIINIINQYLLFKQSIRFLSINKNLFYSEIRNNLLIRSCLQIAYVCGIHDGYIHGTNIYNKALNSKFNLNNYLLPPTITGGEPPSDPGKPGTP